MRATGTLACLAALAAGGGACHPAGSPERAAPACSLPPRGDPPASILADPTFARPSWDSGPIDHACLAVAPWGGDSWGAEAASFQDDGGGEPGDRWIDRARLAVRGGVATLSARDTAGRWSFARVLQGDVWGGSNCGGVPWRRFEPVPVAGGRLALDFDVCLLDSELDSVVGSWILVGANVWASSPSLPAPGRDRHGRKPLVVDLMVHHRTSMLGIRDGSHEDERAYHDQVSVADIPPRRWRHVSIDLTQRLRDATRRFALERSWQDLAIEQVELVAEVHDARATARVARVSLRRLAE